MVPLRLTLEGFLSYCDETTFNFNDCNLWMLAGANGAGKSSVFDAITYALFKWHRAGRGGRGGPQNASDLINRHSDRLSVALEFSSGGNVYRAERTLPRHGAAGRVLKRAQGATWVAVTGTENDAEFDRQINTILGMSVETFTASVLLRQGNAEALLEAEPRKRFEMLSQVVDLSAYQKLHERAKTYRDYFAIEVKTQESQLALLASVSAEQIEEQQRKADEAKKQAEAAGERCREIAALRVHSGNWTRWKEEQATLTQEQATAERLLHDADTVRLNAARLLALNAVIPILTDVADAEAALAAARKEATTRTAAVERLIEQQGTKLGVCERGNRDAFRAAVENGIVRCEEAKDALPYLRQFNTARTRAVEALSIMERYPYVCIDPVPWGSIAAPLEKAIDEARLAEQKAVEEVGRAAQQAADCKERLERFQEAGEDKTCRYCGQPLPVDVRGSIQSKLEQERADTEQRLTDTKGTLHSSKIARIHAEDELKQARHSYDEMWNTISGSKRTQAENALRIACEDAFKAVEALPVSFAGRFSLSKQDGTTEAWTRSPFPADTDLEHCKSTADGLAAARKLLTNFDAAVQNEGAAHAEVLNCQLVLAERRKRLPADCAYGTADVPALEDEQTSLVGADARLDALNKAEREQDERNAKLRKIIEDIDKIPEAARRPDRELAAEETQAKADETKARNIQHQAEREVDTLSDRRDRIAFLKGERDRYRNQEGVYRTLHDLLGPDKLQRYLLREAEDAIVAGANEWLEKFSGGALRLEPRPEGHAARGKDSALDLLCLNLQVAEEAALPLACLSGSQKFRIAVSLALAIGQYASRSHARIRSVIIDEGFGSLDPAGQADMVDVLKAVAGNLERVIVVSHLETFADGFQDRFEITLDDKRSRVRRVVGGIAENAVAI